MEKSSMSVTPEDMKLNLWSGIDNYITLILPYLFTESLIKDFFELLINFLDAEQLSPLWTAVFLTHYVNNVLC